MNNLKYTDDVKESIHLAKKLAKKSKPEEVPDRMLLKGLLMTSRTFNRVDVLLKELQTPADRLNKLLQSGASTNGKGAPAGNLIATAEAIAREEAKCRQTVPVVQVEHLIKALCYSRDPLVTDLLAQHNITPDRVDKALVGVNSKNTKHTVLFFTKELAEVVAFVLFFLIMIKTFLGELRLIPSESMVPLLQVEDRLVIERVTRWFRPYQRGDVLVFYPPSTELRQDPWSVFLRITGFSGLIYRKEDKIDVAYIKRLIGLPGDLVDVRPGDGVYVNGEKLDEPYVKEIADTCTMVQPDMLCEPIRVPEGMYYMLGDNRNQSQDSRFWGFADQRRVIGRAVFRIWPVNRVGTLPPAPYQDDEAVRGSY